MNIFIILLLALDLRMVRSFFHSLNVRTESSHDVLVVSDLDKCPNAVQPLCATNGKEFLYFQNRCHMEVKNFEVLTQGLMEYLECPLFFCIKDCPKCAFIDEPVCAADVVTGEKRIFDNSCEVERTMCITKRAWSVVHINECIMDILSRILKPLNNILQNSDCPKSCPLEHRPVCARFMTLAKEFTNVCELKSTICRTQMAWHIIRQGHCHPSDFFEGNQISTEINKCSNICPSDYKPICAKLHNERRVFNNRCELDNIICQSGHNWQVIKEGPCLEAYGRPQYRECPEFCLNEHKPVCARFGKEQKEFRNLCELLKANCTTNTNWEILNLGPCIRNSKPLLPLAPKCPQTCDKSHKPICAKFRRKLKEFRNQCELQKAICETNTDWKLLKRGRCPLATNLNSICRQMCTKEFMPLCASSNGQLREFLNSCEFEKHSCETNTAWTLIKSGSCPLLSINYAPNSTECPSLCPKEYKPICASFQSKLREFDSECEMAKARCENNTNWQLLKPGRCPLNFNIKGPCARICAQEFSPVCARFNGKLREFFNSCELEKIECRTNTTWEVLHRGPCFVNQFKRLVKNSCEYATNDPVCGIYGYGIKTFDNVCQLAMEIERSGNIWSVLHRGTCSDITGSTIDNSVENNIKNYVTKWTTANDMSSINTTIEGQPMKEESSLKQDSKLSAKTEEYCESDEEDDYDPKDNDADHDSREESSSSDDDETFRHWTQAQIHTLHSDEDYTDNEPLQSKAYDKEKTEKFNYDASEEINLKENNEIINSLPNAITPGATKSNDSFSEESSFNQSKLEQVTAPPNKNEEWSNSDSEVEKQNYQTEKMNSTNSIAENAPPCDADTLTLADKNSPETYLHNEQNLKNNENDLEYNTLKAQNPISFEESKSTRFMDEQSYEDSKSDEKAAYTKEISESCEEHSTYGKYQQSSNQTSSVRLTDVQQNLQANLTLNNNYMYEKSHYTDHSANIQYPEIKPDKVEAINRTESDAGQDYKLHINETSFKKGEIYNGAVYKAPVYDAPTYNFIYTAPFNYPGFELHQANQNNTLAKQRESGAKTKLPFYPFHFFTPLAAMPGVDFAEPNLMPLPHVNNDSLKQILNYTHRKSSNEKPLNAYSTLPSLPRNFVTPDKLASNLQPVSAPPSSKTLYSPSLTQQYATLSNTVNDKQNSTLLNEIIKTLKALTNQV